MALDKESARRSAKAGDLTLTYYEAGERTDVGGGLPLVMLHGGGPGASAWSNFGRALPHFASTFRTLLVDQPGFGGARQPPGGGNHYPPPPPHPGQPLAEPGLQRTPPPRKNP